MSIYIKEYLNSSSTFIENSCSDKKIKIKESCGQNISQILKEIKKGSIIQMIEGLHVGPTRNYNWYTIEALEDSKNSWTNPYEAPLIMHHNEKNGKIIGRIKNAEIMTKKTRSGTPALLFTAHVSDKDGVEQILDGRLKTPSVGIIANDVKCSICGEDIELDENGNSICGHIKGHEYDGQVCYWMIYAMEAKELSYVIVPSDIYAHNLETFCPETNKTILKEGDIKMDKIQMKEHLEQKESTEVQEEVPKKIETVDNRDLLITKLKEENENLKKDIEKLKEKNKIVDEIKDVLKEKEIELQQEKNLRESLENDMKDYKVFLKENLISEVITLRESLGRPTITKENLQKRSEEFLKYTVQDLKEELDVKNSKTVEIKEEKEEQKTVEIKEAADPTIHTDETKIEKKKNINVKENKTVSNIEIEESSEELLSKIYNL